MKLNEWIENKKAELVNNKTFKSVELRDISECKISKIMMSQIFDFEKKKIDLDTEVEDFDRNTLTEEIDGFSISFNVVKPRCRKAEYYSLNVRRV